jgi:hypothetical protein
MFNEEKQNFRKELYIIDKKEGYILPIKDKKRKLKPSELLKPLQSQILCRKLI